MERIRLRSGSNSDDAPPRTSFAVENFVVNPARNNDFEIDVVEGIVN